MEESNFFLHVPTNWQCYKRPAFGMNRRVELTRASDEFDNIENEFTRQGINVRRIVRHEQVNKYMQFLVRQQHLLALYPGTNYYTMRQYVRLNLEEVESALRNHLDKRRNPRINFSSNISSGDGDVVVIVSVITDSPHSTTYHPDRDSNYIIEYVVYLE